MKVRMLSIIFIDPSHSKMQSNDVGIKKKPAGVGTGIKLN